MVRAVGSALATAILVLLACDASGQSADSGITGLLTISPGGYPVYGGAEIRAFTLDGVAIGVAYSDDDGRYRLVLPAGTYNLLVQEAAFAKELYDRIPCRAVDCPIGSGGTLVIVQPGSFTTVDLALRREGVLTGQHRWPGGHPGLPPYSEIGVYNAAGSKISYGLGARAYVAAGLTPGKYFVRAKVQGGWLGKVLGGPYCDDTPGVRPCRITDGTPISVVEGMTTVADPDTCCESAISGFVEAPVALPAGSRIELVAGETPFTTTTIDPTGRFAFSFLAPGVYTVRTRLPASSTLQDTSVVLDLPFDTDAPVTLRLSDFTGGISGTLTLASAPFDGAIEIPTIEVYDSSGVLSKTAEIGDTGSKTTRAGGAYQWTIRGLRPGLYYVRTRNTAEDNTVTDGTRGWYVDHLYGYGACVAADCDPRNGTPIRVTGSTLGTALSSGVDFSLEFGARFSGTVPAWHYLHDVRVNVFDSRGVLVPGRTSKARGRYDAYFAAGLPAGTYYIELERQPDVPPAIWRWDGRPISPAQLYKAIPCAGCPVTSGTPLVLGAGEVLTGVDFAPATSHAIKGTVRSNTSAPLSTISVEIYSADGILVQATTSFADGFYMVPGLNPGTYYARTTNDRGFVDVVYAGIACGGCNPLNGTPIIVGAEDATGIDFVLTPGVDITGTITTPPPAGSSVVLPLTGAGVTVWTSSGTLAALGITDVRGRYLVTVPAGVYRARTEPLAGYTQVLYDGQPCPQGTCDIGSGTPIAVSTIPVTGIDFSVSACAATSVMPAALATAAVGVPYRQVLSVIGGTAPFYVTVSSGGLPVGLTLESSTGILSGTPTSMGRYGFTVASTDQTGCAGSRTYTMDIPACALTMPPSLEVSAAASSYRYPQTCPGEWTVDSNVGWIAAGRTSSGAVVIEIEPNALASVRTGTVRVGSRTLSVRQVALTEAGPYGVVDSPVDGGVVSRSVPVTGWALDDGQVSRVAVYRDSIPGEPAGIEVYLGDATFVQGARPDVEATYPGVVNSARAGWGYLLLSDMLPGHGNGTFRLAIYATDIDGHRTLLGRRTILAANSTATTPFGAIDAPEQGAIVSGGHFINWGWALTPQPAFIPLDGSTIKVFIDGVPIGPLGAYNLFRSDVVTLFPNLKNSPGPVGYRVIDTATLHDGVHTIAWVATDDAGNATGIGSRYFRVQNSAWLAASPSSSTHTVVPPAVTLQELAEADGTAPIPAKVPGRDLGRRAASLVTLPLVDSSVPDVTMHPFQRLELKLRRERTVCAATFEGYEVAAGELRELPVGASLDRDGVFYWQPGPAFLGTYRLLFVETSCEGARARLPVTIIVRPGR